MKNLDTSENLKRVKNKYIKPFKYIFSLLVILSISLIMISFIYTLQLIFIVAALLLIIAFIVLFIGYFYAEEKAITTSLFPEIITNISTHKGDSITYLAYPKELALMFKESGLFSINAFSRVRYAIKKENPPFTLLNLSIIMSTGSASREIFKGGLIKLSHQKDYHALINQEPGYLEDVSYQESRLEKAETIYIEESKEVFLDDFEPYLRLMRTLKENYDANHVRASITPNALYIAFDSKKLPMKLYSFKERRINEIYDNFKELIDLVSL